MVSSVVKSASADLCECYTQMKLVAARVKRDGRPEMVTVEAKWFDQWSETVKKHADALGTEARANERRDPGA
jgi:NCAIR mutase (PurE)-related protein